MSGSDTPAEQTEMEEIRRPATDEELVLAALVGNLTAFDELARRYRGAVTIAAQQILGSRAAAEDVAQDVFVIAFQALPNLEDPARFGGWLRAIARHRASRTATREKRITATEPSTLEILSEERAPDLSGMADPARGWEKREDRDAVWAALEQVSPEHREALYLHYCEEWPLAQIAAFLAVPETTIKGRLFRAREALRKLLTREPSANDEVAELITKGVQNSEPGRRYQSRNTANPSAVKADVQPLGALQPDRGAIRRSYGRGQSIQSHLRAADRTGNPLYHAVQAVAGGRFV